MSLVRLKSTGCVLARDLIQKSLDAFDYTPESFHRFLVIMDTLDTIPYTMTTILARLA